MPMCWENSPIDLQFSLQPGPVNFSLALGGGGEEPPGIFKTTHAYLLLQWQFWFSWSWGSFQGILIYEQSWKPLILSSLLILRMMKWWSKD